MSHPLDPPAIHRSEILERQERVRAATAAAGFDALLAIGRSFYDRPGDVAWLANHQPPFPTTVFSDENRGMGHAFFLLPVSGPSTLVTDPRRWRSDLIVADDARAGATTRSAAAVDRWTDRLDGAVVAIGNAPTALFRLLEGRSWEEISLTDIARESGQDLAGLRGRIGDRFDIRGYHQAALENGYVPLWAMEYWVDHWIEQTKRGEGGGE